MIRILLLDIDGVLVQPLGYRAALRTAYDHLTGRADLLSESLLADLEARGISSEFDMLPLLVAALWQEPLARSSRPDLPADVLQAAEHLRHSSADVPAHLHLPPFPIEAGLFPAEAAYRARLFPSLPEPLRQALLLHTRDVYRSATTRLFQHFVLGSQEFERTYRLPAWFQTESYLQRYDRPLLSGSAFGRLERGRRTNEVILASITARPSRPPRGVAVSPGDYPPEAEQALALVGLEDIPLIGLGRLQYIGQSQGLPPQVLLKPSPVQALAAILAACSGEEQEALRTAIRSWQDGHSPPSLPLPAAFEVHVVEDTLAGIRSTQQAVHILRGWGHEVSLFPWGLSAGHPQKRHAFQKEGIPCFDTWDDLLDAMGL